MSNSKHLEDLCNCVQPPEALHKLLFERAWLLHGNKLPHTHLNLKRLKCLSIIPILLLTVLWMCTDQYSYSFTTQTLSMSVSFIHQTFVPSYSTTVNNTLNWMCTSVATLYYLILHIPDIVINCIKAFIGIHFFQRELTECLNEVPLKISNSIEDQDEKL